MKLLQTDKDLSRIYLIYYLILSAIFAASFFPDSRVWGYNMWAFIPATLKYSLLAIGLVAPFMSNFILKRIGDETDDAPNDKKFYLISGLLLVGFVLLFYFFRSTTHFLGDGYETLSGIETENVFTKSSNLGAVELNRLVYSLFGNALQSIQFISYFAGMLFVVLSIFLSKYLSKNNADRTILLLTFLSWGQMLLFFGYVENYSLFNVIVFAFTVTGFLNLRNKHNILYPTLLALIAPFFHIFGVILFPPLILLWIIRKTNLPTSELFGKKTFRYSLFGLIILGVVGFVYAYNNFLFLQFAIVPFDGNRFVLEDYTLFSIKHLLDIANQLLILLPALPLLLYLLIMNFPKKSNVNNSLVFLILLALEAFVLLFIFDPKLGMPRDWDLFAFVGIPTSTLLIMFVISVSNKVIQYRQVLVLSTILGWLILTPRIYTNVVPQAAIDQVQSYFKVDVRKSMQYVHIVQNYALDSNYLTSAIELNDFYNLNFKEKQLSLRAKSFMNEGQYQLAINDLLEAIRINPTYHGAYLNLGNCYLALKQFEKAREVLEISKGLNPYNSQTFENLGIAYFQLNRTDDAMKALQNSFERKNNGYITINYLRAILEKQPDKQEYRKFVNKIHDLIFNDKDYQMDYFDVLIRQNKIGDLVKILREFSPNGISTDEATKLIDKYPELEKHLKK